MKSEYKKILSNTSLFAIGSFGSSLLGMLFIPFYTSILSTADYGVSDLISTTTALLYPFASIAISEAIMRFALDKGSDRNTIYSGGIFTVLAGFVLVLLSSPLIYRTTIGPYLIYFLMYFLCYGLHTITSYFVKGIEKVKIYAIAGIINTLIVIAFNLIFLLWLKIGVHGYLLASIMGHLTTTLFMFFGARAYRYISFPWKLDSTLYRKMLIYSLPIIPNSISWWISNSSDKYMLNYYTSVSEVGIYSVSYKIPTIVMTVTGFFMSAWQLSAVDCFERKDVKNLFGDVFSRFISLNFLVATGLIITSKLFGSFLYSKDFFMAWKYVPTLIIANVFNTQASFLGTVYTSAKKTKMLSVTTITGALSNIAMNFVLIPRIGALGAAIATAFSYLVMFLFRLVNTRKILEYDFVVWRNITMFIALIAMCILVTMDRPVLWGIATVIAVANVIFERKLVIDATRTILSALAGKLRTKG
ncbi:MAG: polysaccharide biosynthesis C-terminal domain-containing protein [Monoglobales bacterium]